MRLKCPMPISIGCSIRAPDEAIWLMAGLHCSGLHEQWVQCIREGHMHKRFECGYEAALAAHSMNGNPYDRRTPSETLATV